MELEGTLPS